MERGKQICRILKDIRKQIAEENDIEFVTSECRHKGDCAGTCPKCESEVRYLESQLARRRSMGRTVRLTGLSLGLTAVLPAVLSCDVDGDMLPPGQTYGDVPPLSGDPEVPENVNLGENLIFDLITYETFMDLFSKGGWQEAEIYDVYPGGKLGDEMLQNIIGYVPRKFALKSSDTIKQYFAYNHDPERFDHKLFPFYYGDYSNQIVIGSYGKDQTLLTVASINENEMVCYGEVFAPNWAPDAFIGKYVFKRVSEETVAEWDAEYASEKPE